MSAVSPARPNAAAVALPKETSPRQDLWRALAVAVGAVAIGQGYLLLEERLSSNVALAGTLVALLAVFALVPLLAWWEKRPWRDYGLWVPGGVGLPLAYTAIFTMIFLTIHLEPGFLFGFGHEPPVSSTGFGFYLYYGPLVGLAECTVFLGVLFRRLTRRYSLVGSMFVAGVFFAAADTNPWVLPQIGWSAALQVLFTTTLTAFVLGLVLALYFYKEQWTLLGPITLQAALVWVATLFPFGSNLPSWQDAFAATLLSYAGVLLAVGVLLQEPRLQAQKYLGRRIGPVRNRFRDRAQNWRAARDTVVAAAVVVIIVGSVNLGLPAVLGTPSTPVLAIATGSMVPTFHRGTLVLIEGATPSQIHVGTIIAFHVSCLPAPTVHRVYKILVSGTSPVYLTKGDANPSPDPCDVPFSHVIGRAVVWVPYVGYLILDPLFAAALIALAVVSVALLREPRT